MLSRGNTYISSAYQRLQVISQDENLRRAYEAREKALRDYNQGMLEARESGKEEGIEIGERRGIEIGERRGIEIGKEQGKTDIARVMLTQGYGVSAIVSVTGLTAEQVENLK